MIPLYEMTLIEGEPINAIALVGSPAMQDQWFAFNKQGDKQMVFGALLIPNKPILRYDGNGNPFYIVFSREQIEAIRNQYFKKGDTTELNAEHIPTAKINGYLVESFIKDTARGMIPPETHNHHPDGTWFGTIHLEDANVWNEYVKTGMFTGFSIEGKFNPKPILNPEILTAFNAYLDKLLNR